MEASTNVLIEEKLREVRVRLNSLSGTLSEQNINTSCVQSEEQLYIEKNSVRGESAWGDRLCRTVWESNAGRTPFAAEVEAGENDAAADESDENNSDVFKAIHRRLQEKLRSLEKARAAAPAAEEGPKGRSPPPRDPRPESSRSSVLTGVLHDDHIEQGKSPLSPGSGLPPNETSDATAAPPNRQSPVNVELSFVSDGDDESNCHREMLEYQDQKSSVNMPAEALVPPNGMDGNERRTVSPTEKKILGRAGAPRVSFRGSVPAPAATREYTREAGAPRAVPRAASSSSREPQLGSNSGKTSKPRSRSSTDDSGRRASTSQSPGCALKTGSPRTSGASGKEERSHESRCASVEAAFAKASPPRPLWSAATILDHVTGAELLAIFRMRRLVTSVGDTEEDRLPTTRCHAVYLTPREHEQLLSLREVLQRRQSQGTVYHL